jgi:small-conductance mechanosensitive channel
VSSLVAALGVGSLAIGLAAQQTIGNMIAGFVLLVDRPFRPGDRIRLATGESGEVLDVGVRSTRIRLGDRNLLIVPNTELANSRVLNYATAALPVRGEVKVLVSYATDLERATGLLRGLPDGEARIVPGSVTARVGALLPQGVELQLGFEPKLPLESPDIEDQLRRRLVQRFREAGLPLQAMPQA